MWSKHLNAKDNYVLLFKNDNHTRSP